MGKGSDDEAPKGHSRRDMFKLPGAASAPAGAGDAQAQGAPPHAAHRQALETLPATEAEILEANCARLIPSDANGPGAKEARAAHYIDRALGGALHPPGESYRSGLMSLDAQARASRGAPFSALDAQIQDGTD